MKFSRQGGNGTVLTSSDEEAPPRLESPPGTRRRLPPSLSQSKRGSTVSKRKNRSCDRPFLLAGSANFEDRENFLTVVLLCCKSVCDPSAHIFTIISLFYSASTIGIEPELCFSKCCISDMAWPTYLPLCQ